MGFARTIRFSRRRITITNGSISSGLERTGSIFSPDTVSRDDGCLVGFTYMENGIIAVNMAWCGMVPASGSHDGRSCDNVRCKYDTSQLVNIKYQVSKIRSVF